ncbi:unnamed protein product [Lymnaea stagnalis]|uniref:RRM domain-containing protein n=1 Tax=Lymnaea stagnalis TaxID=6523 RepID=A0AAV2HW39_LYMST
MDSYKPGQVSALLFSKKRKSEEKSNDLAKLFSVKNPSANPAQLPSPQRQKAASANILKQTTDSNIVKEHPMSSKKKRKKSGVSSEEMDVTSPKKPLTSEPFPFIHETLLQNRNPVATKTGGVKRKLEKSKKDEDEPEGKRFRRNRKRDKVADKRTIFVGNCPLSADKKILKKLFKEYGEIESIRFRCAPPADPTLPRRAIVITKNFHEQCNNYVAYIVFKEVEAAMKALERNGYLLDDLHIRVDIAAMANKHDKKRSVFVGNLPFTITEEVIRAHFEDCGDITNVRIVRDRMTSLGKGICYVQFESKDSVGLATKLNNSELQGRQLRVMVCSNKQKKTDQKLLKKQLKEKDKQPAKAKVKKIAFAPSNISNNSFKTILKAKKEKRFRKMKKKKENAKKTDGLSSIYGDVASVDKKKNIGKTKTDLAKRNKTKETLKGKTKFSPKGSSFKGKKNFSQKGSSFKGKKQFSQKGSSFKGKKQFSQKGNSFKGRKQFSQKGSSFKGKRK